MSHLTTHVLDIAAGRPAPGIGVVLERQADTWETLATGRTDEDGRIGDLGPALLEAGVYRLRFATGTYLEQRHGAAFFPEVTVCFRVDPEEPHYHVPLLLSPHGYSTYRGS